MLQDTLKNSFCIWLAFSGVTVLLALTVFNTMVTEILPKVSDALPILGAYESAQMNECLSLKPLLSSLCLKLLIL